MIWTVGASSTGADTGPPGRSPLRGGATLDYPVYSAASLDGDLGDGEKILNIASARPELSGAGFFCPPGRTAWAAMSLYSPTSFRRLCAVLRPAGGIFAPASSRAGERPKHKTSVKAIYRPATAFYTLVAIPIFPHRKTAHRSCHRPAQGIKQPRPAPSWSRPGYYHLFRARDRTAQRSLSASHQAQNFRAHSISLSILSFFFGLIGRDNQVNSNRGHAL